MQKLKFLMILEILDILEVQDILDIPDILHIGEENDNNRPAAPRMARGQRQRVGSRGRK